MNGGYVECWWMCGGLEAAWRTVGCLEELKDVWRADSCEEELRLCGKLEVGLKAL
jgi:hypothetical protein